MLLFFFSGICIHWISCIQHDNGDQCPLWHIHDSNGECVCGASLNGVINCDKDFIHVENGYCLTWNNLTTNEELHRCPLSHWTFSHTGQGYYSIPIDVTRQRLNHVMCHSFNRQGTQCSQCISGYGPSVFSDGVTCADCSKHKYLWILNLMFQLTMVTLMCLAFMIFQIKGTSSPLNIIIAYTQNVAFQYGLSTVDYFGQKVGTIIITVLDIWNLDYFRLLLHPLCISSSLTAIHCILFQYIIAIYPLLFTGMTYFCINNIEKFVIFHPLRGCLSKSWDPKTTILHTFATFFLFSYTKLLYTSISLLLVVHSYNVTGKKSPNSAVLLFDPSIKFLHFDHAPYATIALLTLLICIVPPPMLLLLYPTKLLRKCFNCFRFQRWDVLHHIMDVFQGWYKDGTEGTYDYRFLSAFFLVLRIAHGGKTFAISLVDNKEKRMLIQVLFIGVLQILMGLLFFILKPYKVNWKSKVDGIIFTLAGCYMLIETLNNKWLFIFVTIVIILIVVFMFIYASCRKFMIMH